MHLEDINEKVSDYGNHFEVYVILYCQLQYTKFLIYVFGVMILQMKYKTEFEKNRTVHL